MTKIKQQYLCEKEVAILLGVSTKSLQNARYRGNGIPFIKLDSGQIRYDRDVVDAYMHDRRR